jgi:hypothetical protein
MFCSAGLVLPDKAGRVANLAGWNQQAVYGVRLYTPSGSPGHPGNTDWQEDVNTVRLQVRIFVFTIPCLIFAVVDKSLLCAETPLVSECFAPGQW